MKSKFFAKLHKTFCQFIKGKIFFNIYSCKDQRVRGKEPEILLFQDFSSFSVDQIRSASLGFSGHRRRFDVGQNQSSAGIQSLTVGTDSSMMKMMTSQILLKLLQICQVWKVVFD